MTDDPLIDPKVWGAMRREIAWAHAKHNGRTPLSPSVSDWEKLAVVTEELGEVARCTTYDEGGDDRHLYTELVQLSTMASAWASAVLQRIRAAEPEMVEVRDGDGKLILTVPATTFPNSAAVADAVYEDEDAYTENQGPF